MILDLLPFILLALGFLVACALHWDKRIWKPLERRAWAVIAENKRLKGLK